LDGNCTKDEKQIRTNHDGHYRIVMVPEWHKGTSIASLCVCKWNVEGSGRRISSFAENGDNGLGIAMQIRLDLPEELAMHFGQDAESRSRAALEALALEGVRSRTLSTAQARRLLGFRSRHQMEAFLKAHGLDLPVSLEQVRSESDAALAFTK
jgi:hypothetical protein